MSQSGPTTFARSYNDGADPYPDFQSLRLTLQLAAEGCLVVRIVTKSWSYGRCGIRNMGWCMMSSRRSKKGSMEQDAHEPQPREGIDIQGARIMIPLIYVEWRLESDLIIGLCAVD